MTQKQTTIELLKEMGLISNYSTEKLWNSVTHSGDWEISAVPGRFPDNWGELAHNMLSDNRLIIIYDVGMCLYHMMKMISTLEYHTNCNGSFFSFRWCNHLLTWYNTKHHKTIVNQK